MGGLVGSVGQVGVPKFGSEGQAGGSGWRVRCRVGYSQRVVREICQGQGLFWGVGLGWGPGLIGSGGWQRAGQGVRLGRIFSAVPRREKVLSPLSVLAGSGWPGYSGPKFTTNLNIKFQPAPLP